MSFFRKLFGLGPKVDHFALLEQGAILIDVRTPAEFKDGHVPGSKNVPLDTIQNKVKKIENLNKPIVLCCRSGMRSGQATAILKRNGVQNVYNGGSWLRFK
jgi:rhodanese-related sulfurtransferase